MNKKLKAKIVEKFGNQFIFSLIIGAHESEVSKIIRGRRVLSQEAAQKWASALDVTPEEILEG